MGNSGDFMMDPGQAPETHLRDHVGMVLKRKWLVLATFLSVVAGTTLYVIMQPFIYASTVSLLVEPSSPNVMSGALEEVYVPTKVDLNYYRTQYEILKSHKLLGAAARTLNLTEQPEYSGKAGPSAPLASWTSELVAGVQSAFRHVVPHPTGPGQDVPEAEAERRLVNAFSQHVRVSPVPNTRIVRVTVESMDPYFAARAANTIASIYIKQTLDMKVATSEQAVTWIASRVDQLRGKVEESERALQEFAKQHGLVDFSKRAQMGTQKLAELNAQLVEAETQRAQAEARLRQIASVMNDRSKFESSAQVLGSTQIQKLRVEEIQATQKVDRLSQRYGSKHPAMVKATAELREVQAQLQYEVSKVFASVKAEYDTAKARERVLRRALDQQRSDVMATGQHEVQYNILEREAESNRQLYEMFLKRMKETDIVSEIQTSNIYIADPAIASLAPVKPKRRQFVFFAAIFGLLLGVGLTFFLEYMDDTFRSPDDITRYLPDVAFLGYIPVAKEFHKQPGGVELAMHRSPESSYGEQLRSIRSTLTLSAADKPPSSLLVTSSLQEEGKSTFAIGLATSFAQLNQCTILIDGDLRKPSLDKVFNLRCAKGLSHYLVGKAELSEVMRETDVPNLKVIPCGAIPPNPAELLHSNRMRDLIEIFRKEETVVVIDGPPVLNLADPMIVSHSVDGVILVVRAAHSTRKAVKHSIKKLREAHAKVLGVVLQLLKRHELPAYYGNYYPYLEKPRGGIRWPGRKILRS